VRGIKAPDIMFLFILRITLGTFLLMGVTGSAWSQDYSLTVYGGRVTEDTWAESLLTSTNFVDAYIMVGALARTMKSLNDGAFTVEVEGQVAKYSGEQEHFEFNLAVAGRWHNFHWDNVVDTSFAFGIGPSWAAEEPEVEVMIHGTTKKCLVYWFSEIAFEPPDSNWAVVLRLHHRSTGFGLIAEKGGTNTLAAGLKYTFR
jgi:hypothetical protein